MRRSTRKFTVALMALLLTLGGISGGSQAVGAHTGDPDHDHPENCADEVVIDSTEMCFVYASDGHTIKRVRQQWISALELPANVAPEAVFGDQLSVAADMDITAAELQQYRLFYSRTHFTQRLTDGTVFVDSSGQVSQGEALTSALPTGTAQVDSLLTTDVIDGGKRLLVNFVDGRSCNAGYWGKEYGDFGWFAGQYEDNSRPPGTVKTCIQAVIKLEVEYTDGDRQLFSMRLKDNQNGPDSVFGAHDTGPGSETASSAPLSISIASDRWWISENNGKARVTVSLSRPLEAGEQVVVPLTVTRSLAYRDWNIRFRTRESDPGVSRTAVGAHSELTFTEGAQTATLILVGRQDAGSENRFVRIAIGKRNRAPSATGVDGEIAIERGAVKIKIRDEDR
ncbi:MAG: hypothetical protein OXM54_17565 [Acidimicrobiaceae bacterium]|nr:hypothetical protein [Acidimicrobiaceae bacterium]